LKFKRKKGRGEKKSLYQQNKKLNATGKCHKPKGSWRKILH